MMVVRLLTNPPWHNRIMTLLAVAGTAVVLVTDTARTGIIWLLVGVLAVLTMYLLVLGFSTTWRHQRITRALFWFFLGIWFLMVNGLSSYQTWLPGFIRGPDVRELCYLGFWLALVNFGNTMVGLVLAAPGDVSWWRRRRARRGAAPSTPPVDSVSRSDET